MYKGIIKINDIVYHSYMEMCMDLNIDYKEFVKIRHENPDISQLDLLRIFYSKVLVRTDDSSFRVSRYNSVFKYRLIKASCPCCHADCDDIVYQNSGPIIRIYCSKCGLVYNENDAKKNGFEDLIVFWNHIGMYIPQD